MGEIEEMNEKYLTILNEERESILRLKGENGVMKKKFASLQNEIEDQIEETKKMNSQESNLKKTIVSLKREIEKLDNAMLSRDNIIGEKEKKIYKLKKKNQKLQLITSKFGYDLSQIIQFIQCPKKLRKYFVNKMYNKNKKNSLMLFVDQNYDINKNVLKEYSRQRQHLILCVNSLKKKLNKQSKINRKENYQIMMQNVNYMTEIQELRKELKGLTQVSSDKLSGNDGHGDQQKNNREMLQNQIEEQKIQIQELRDEIQRLHDNDNDQQQI